MEEEEAVKTSTNVLANIEWESKRKSEEMNEQLWKGFVSTVRNITGKSIGLIRIA